MMLMPYAKPASKVENGGTTPAGRISAAEWNSTQDGIEAIAQVADNAYAMPENGIPEEDLEAEVQDKLAQAIAGVSLLSTIETRLDTLEAGGGSGTPSTDTGTAADFLGALT